VRTGLAIALATTALVAAAPSQAQTGIVRDGNTRFEVLSPTLVRIEYSGDGVFEDRPTMLAFDRHVTAPPYSALIDGDRLTIRTKRIELSYVRGSGPFGAENLQIRVRMEEGASATVAATPVWQPASYTPDGFTALGYFGSYPDSGAPRTHGNLGGWARGLDSQRGPRELHDGLLSRDGWFFIDDSRSVVLVDGGETYATRGSHGAYQDGYLFGYGHDYARALADYRRLSGPAPLLPRKAFGVWFSRYFPFTDADYRTKLLPAFRRERVPLDVLVVDTEFRAPRAWDGWNWNSKLFPDPPGFLRWAHGMGLDVTFNAHPSISLRDPRFAAANAAAGGLIGPALGPLVSGVTADPGAAGDVYYTFDFANRRHLKAYFDLHAPFERDGADFWWLDWCCEEARVGPVVPDGTIAGDAWINSRYARRNAARGKRWLNLARVGGSFEDWNGARPGPWGEQRSAIHFTGDAYSTWPMLDWQSRFVVGEGNAGLPYVSNDIAGFQGSDLTPQMYARWVQSAAFAPILRLHSSKNGVVARLPWEYSGKVREVAADFLRRREALVPYMYTLAREAYDTGLPLTRGMYLEWPQFDEAYSFDRQYMLGSALLVAPVGVPGDPAVKRVWFPPGTWVDWFTGQRFRGPAVRELRVPLERAPVFARAGAMVPLAPYRDYSAQRPLDALTLRVFAGADGGGLLYEDAGEGFAYRRGAFARTRWSWSQRERRLVIGAARGRRFAGQVAKRSYRLVIEGVSRPARVLIGGQVARRVARGVGWAYDAPRRTVVVRTGRRPTGRTFTVTFRG
jgi:alpha-glucosidase (family GH31 glycosyl hydrolase)